MKKQILKIRKSPVIFAFVAIAIFTGNVFGQGNQNNNGNGLWQAAGSNTVFTNRYVKINNSLSVRDKVTTDILHIHRWLQLGDNTFYFVPDIAGVDHIRSDNGRIALMAGDNTTFNSNIKVGIGTTNPTEKLHIKDGSIYVEGEGQGIIVNEGGHKRVGLMKYYGHEAGIWRVINQDFEIGRLNVPSLPGIPTIFTIDLYIPCWRKFVTCA